MSEHKIDQNFIFDPQTWDMRSELLGIHAFHDYFIVLFIHLFYLFIKIKDFMSKIPHGKVPKLDSQGSRYRVKQLVYQMPLQDFSSKHCRKLTLDQKMAMDDMCTKRIEKALGVGKNVVFLTLADTYLHAKSMVFCCHQRSVTQIMLLNEYFFDIGQVLFFTSWSCAS